MHLSVDDILAQAIERRKLEEQGPAVEVDGVEAQEEGEGEEVDQTAASTLAVGYSGVIVVHAHNTAVACCPPPLAPAERLPGAADRGVKRFYKSVDVHAADAAGRPVDDEASEDIVREPLIVRVADVLVAHHAFACWCGKHRLAIKSSLKAES